MEKLNTIIITRAGLRAALAMLVISPCIISCGEDPPDAGDGHSISDKKSDGESGACSSSTRVGGIEVDVDLNNPTISGAFADGVVPRTKLWEVKDSKIGDCRLVQERVPSCDEDCASDETCDFNGECIKYPLNHSVGVVLLEGLSKPVKIDPTGKPGHVRYNFTDLTSPIVTPGTRIIVQAKGASDDFEGFTLHGQGVEYMKIPNGDLVLGRGKDLKIDWTPGGHDAMITLKIDINQHGASPINIICEVKDTGSYTIPGALVTKLIEDGVTGYPSLAIRRWSGERMNSDDVKDACIDFEISSSLVKNVKVEGHIPCDNDDDCPAGMTCDKKNQTCVDAS